MPILFYLYGKKIRGKSKFAPAPDIEQDKRRDEEGRLGGSDESMNGEGGEAEKDKSREGSVVR
jgi:DHA1 family multidrug resistance protein-like MFS transporter